MKDKLNEDFLAFIELLEGKGVEYLIDGVEFEACFPQRPEIDYEGRKMKFIALPDLLRNKQASGRSKDLIDIDALTRQGNRSLERPGPGMNFPAPSLFSITGGTPALLERIRATPSLRR